MASETTPMMKQFRAIRSQLPDDVILFFRLGDFYEMFFDDAVVASSILDIALTKRNKIPMCGVPYHSSETYLAKLIRAGRKVAICDQVEEAGQSKGIVKRDVTRIITPGSIIEENVLESARSNFLAGLFEEKGVLGLAILDLSTGDFRVEESDNRGAILDRLLAIAPPECIYPEEVDATEGLLHDLQESSAILLTAYDDWTFERDAAEDLLLRHFRVRSLEGFGGQHLSAGVGAAGAVLHYISNRLKNRIDHITRLRVGNPAEFMFLDEATLANLELIQARNPLLKGKAPTLLHVLDHTQTAMGARCLRDWILRPLCSLPDIENRHAAVAELIEQSGVFRTLREIFTEVKDLERLIGRLNSSSGNPRDMVAIAQSLRALPAVGQVLQGLHADLFARIDASIYPLPELVSAIDGSLVEEPPANLKDGGVIRAGVNDELDELNSAATDGRKWLAKFQADEQARTGIKTLKVRHNKVFGYYIEVSKANSSLVPDEYVRKQTLVNAERFITPELKEVENKILGAHERAVALEQDLFEALKRKAVEQTGAIQETAQALAQLDVLATFADNAQQLQYVRPEMTEDDVVEIREGRHPVIETLEDGEQFVPNDCYLNNSDQQLHILTGPNMAGKSTYIRQVALICILAQIGSFIPADSGRLCVVDRVFTRVGASDDLARGRSTFMVEMQETANILNNATPRSLVVLDEIGRGTSTYDGISIAWSVAEHLHNVAGSKAKTLFATHYHELTQLSDILNGVKNYSVAVRERGEQIVFLRKIVEGASDRSYGIQVGRLAGLPPSVVDRAKEILYNLEAGSTQQGQPKLVKPKPRKPREDKNQLSLL